MSSEKPRYFLVLLLLLNIAIHLPFLNLPPVSRHVWRQTFTLSVARNFYKEGMDIFHPRVNNRGASDGITGMQFPSYEYGLAGIYKITGEHFWVSRLWSLMIFSIGILFVYWWIFNLSVSTFKGCVAAWCFCWSPELFYHGINALPDILALTAAAGSLATAYQYFKNRKNLWMIISMLLLLLAGLTKIQFLMAGAVWCIWLFSKEKGGLNKTERIIIFISGFAVSGICLGWYIYARKMIAQSGLKDVGLEFRPVSSWHQAFETIRHNLVSDIPELLMGYASFILFVAGIYILIIKRESINLKSRPYILWTVLFIFYYLIELGQMDEHNYYLMSAIPLLVLVVVSGAQYIYEKNRGILFLLIVAQPILSAMRIIHSRWMNHNNEVPVELFNERSCNQLKSAVPSGTLCVMAQDISGCIWFYFLDKKGFSVATIDDLKVMQNNEPRLLRDIELGAGYLYSIDTSVEHDPVIGKYIYKKIVQEGNFNVYQLQK